jgi:hypothetical protein
MRRFFSLTATVLCSLTALSQLAETLAGMVNAYGDLGFMVNVSSATVAMGGSTSAALGPASFALAARVLARPQFGSCQRKKMEEEEKKKEKIEWTWQTFLFLLRRCFE